MAKRGTMNKIGLGLNKRRCNIKKFKYTSLVGAMLFFVPVLFSTSAFADPSITLTISSNTLNLNLRPNSASGTFAKSGDLDINVALSGPGGYTLGIKANTTGANATNLVNTSDSTKTFASISSAVTESDFANASNTTLNNQWGYLPSRLNSVANTSFQPAPDSDGDLLDYTETDDAEGDYTISIGARANISTAIGSYSNVFVITAIANLSCNSTATSIGEAVCMQDFNNDGTVIVGGVTTTYRDAIIDSMEFGRQYQLKDNRDWKTYYVAKMKDGRVWMTQNLDLDLETTPTNVAALTHDNTDLGWTTLNTSATWTPSTATATTAAGYGSNTNTAPASFDSGDTYRYVSTTGTTSSYTSKSACETAHNDGTCPHYHVGNYYNWSAAVASNDTSAITANYTTAPDSICPAGWRLPAGKTSNASTDLGYYGEINYTWVSEGLAKDYVTGTGTATFNPDNSTGWINIRNNPMYMVAAGYKNGTSNVSSLGSYGYFWSSSVYNSTTAYAPYTYSSGLYPTFYSTSSTVRGRGMSIRCIARQTNTGSTTITFDKNAADATGTTGTNNTVTYNANTLNTLPTNGFTRTGYAFNSWNTKADGSGDSYADAGQFYAKTGTATTSVTLYAIWDKVYTITFSLGANATGIYFDGTTYTNGQTVQAIEGKTYQISGVFPTKYGINSWSATAGTIANAAAPTTTYTVANNATITVTGTEATTSITTLTVPTDPVSSNCKNEAVVPQLVYDPRDNEAYYVARLCDGNIWMLDNLRLDLTNSTVINALSSTNTNATDTELAYLKGTSTGTTSDQYPTAGLSGSEWTSSYSYSVPQAAARWKDEIAPVTFGLGSGKNGVYYNYCATSAGTYCWGNGTSYIGSPTTDPNTSSYRDIDGDICPAGWHLPNYTGEFSALYSAYSSGGTLGGNTTLTQAVAHNTALSTPLSGYLSSGSSRYYLGTYGAFWSSTWTNTTNMYTRFVYATSVSFGYYNRYYGPSIRCILGSV